MRRTSGRIRLWLAIWGVLIVATVAVGVATRFSYTDYTEKPEGLRALPSWIHPYEKEGAKDPAGAAIEEVSSVIVEADFTGERRLAYQAAMSRVRVQKVVKGDPDLKGREIEVYEPLALRGGVGRRMISFEGAYRFGATPLRAGIPYLLCMTEAPGYRAVPEGYALVESPLSKIPLTRDVALRIDELREERPSLAELDGIDLVVEDEASAEDYLMRRDGLLDSLGIPLV